jgi:hypothetical protein
MLIIRGSKDSGAMAVREQGEGSIRRRRRASGVRSEQTVGGGVGEWWSGGVGGGSSELRTGAMWLKVAGLPPDA